MLKQILSKASEQTRMFLSWDRRLALTAFAYAVTTFFGRWQILGKGIAIQYLNEFLVDLLTRVILFAVALYVVNLIRAPFLIIKEQNTSIAILTCTAN
jgi:hypothetical protein